MALVHAAPELTRVHHSCAPPAASSWRATCSTGGIRRPAAACAPASPTTCCGCPSWSRHYVEATGDAAILDERVPFLQGRPAATRRGGSIRQPGDRGETATLYEHCLPGARSRPDGRRARPAADGHRRLERRHEPRRRRGPGRERLARLVPACTSCAQFAASGRARAAITAARRPLAQRARASARRARANTPGTATGTGAPSSTTARRSGSAQNAECQIDSHRAERGRCSPAPATRSAPAGAWQPSTSALVRRDDRLILLFTPPSTRRRSIRATSRATCPASARTAASTRTPRSGSCWPSPSSARATEAVELFDMLNPIYHAATARGVGRYKVEPYVIAGDVYSAAAAHRAGRLDLVHRLRRLDVPHDPRVDPRPAAARRRPSSTRASLPHGRAFEIVLPLPHGDLPDRRADPRARSPGHRRPGMDDQPQQEAVIPLVDDGRTHEAAVVIGHQEWSIIGRS